LDKAKELVTLYRQGREPAGTSGDEVWKAKHIYDSAFHPDTGEKMLIIGRMSAQVPMNMTITGCMMTFYRTTPAVIFWQWLNQSFNAVVNYSNRSGETPISTQRLTMSYCLATASATLTALGLNRMVTNMPPVVGRFVPFAAVAAANCFNIPCMRSKELSDGVPVFTEDGERVGESVTAARKGITEVLVSRIVMATPGMGLPPLIMNQLEKGNLFKKMPWARAPVQVGMVGVLLVAATPLCCAIFPQMSSIAVTSLETDLQQKVKALGKPIDRLYFNKGL
jgi:tricarboxylate carrier